MNEPDTDPSDDSDDIELTPRELANEQIAGAVDVAITAIREQLTHSGETKWSVADLIRLLEVRKELDGNQPTIVRAFWLDEPPADYKRKHKLS
jgi:hypothetical protein